MKLSVLSKININAILNIQDQQVALNAQLLAARDAFENKLEFDTYDYQAELEGIAKDTDDLDRFMDSKEEQRQYHIEAHKRLFDDAISKTRQNLKTLQTNAAVQQQQDERELAIKNHMLIQKEMLIQARLEKARLDKQFKESKQVMSELAAKYRRLAVEKTETMESLERIQDKVKNFTPELRATVDHLKDNYRASANPFADYKGSPFDHPAKFAMDRDRSFLQKMSSMQDAARRAVDPDVRNRIEIEITRQKASYGVDQNLNIQSLTGKERIDEIGHYQKIETGAALDAAVLDHNLARKGIKVDFTRGAEPEVQKTTLATTPSRVKEMWSALNREGKLLNSLSRTQGDFDSITGDLAETKHQFHIEQDVATTLKIESKAKSKLIQRLQENLKQAREHNHEFSAECGISLRIRQLVEEARTRKIQEPLQLSQHADKSHGLRSSN